jgi:hypothetical protein
VRRHLAIVASLLVTLLAPATTTALAVQAEQTGCTFQKGFRSLRILIPHIVGECLENERFNLDNGNSEQQTTRGLLVWRKADNWTAFTDGATTWINGPQGLASRPNEARFAWEPTAEPQPAAVWAPLEPPDWAITRPIPIPSGPAPQPAIAAPSAPTRPTQSLLLPAATVPPAPIQQALKPAWDALMVNPGRYRDSSTFGPLFANIVAATRVQFLIVEPSVIEGAAGAYSPNANAIGVSSDVLREDPRVQAVVLAHELTHAAQVYLGLGRKGEECVQMEVEAYVVEVAVWRAFWNGYGPNRTELEQVENLLTRVFEERGEAGIYALVANAPEYRRQCQLAMDEGFELALSPS